MSNYVTLSPVHVKLPCCLLVVSVNFISRRLFYYLNLIYPMRTGLTVANLPKNLLKTLQSRPPVAEFLSANLLYFNKKICIANDVWWTDRYQQKPMKTVGSPASLEHSGGDRRPQLNTHWHSVVTPYVLSIWIKAKVRTIRCQYSSCV